MTIKFRLIQILWRLYPSSWRDEYAEELEALLRLQPITALVIGDVLLSAGRQLLRPDQPWKIGGLFLLGWSALWIPVEFDSSRLSIICT
jgi:hypothetical protein